MKSIAVSKMKASLSQYLKMVKSGEEVMITDRGKPVAKMVPVNRGDLKIPPHLMEMERAGLLSIGHGKIVKNFWDLPRPADVKGYALKTLLKERESAR
jgi:prevent-host-death family protein